MGQLFETEKKPITETDRIRLGSELAQLDQELIATKAEKSKVSRTYRLKVDDLEGKIKKVSSQLAEGEVELDFEVEEIPDDARQFIDILRTDTNERINSRPMNEAEKEASRKRRQPELSFEADADGAGVVARTSGMRPKARGKKPPAKKNGKRT